MNQLEEATLNCIAQDPTTTLSDLISLVASEENVSERVVRSALDDLERKSLIIIDEDIDMVMISLKGSAHIK